MDRDRYVDLFRTESRDQLSAINRALLALEQGAAGRAPVDAVFRAVHTLKGMSATMGYAAVAEFAHELESLLDRVRGGEQALTPELMDGCFAAADALEDGIEHAEAAAPMRPAMRRALERLQELAGGSATTEFRVVRRSDVFRLASEHELPPTAAGASVPAPVPGARLVRVTQAADALLPGVRAFMVLQRLRTLGEVVGCEPAPETLQAATTPQRFTVALVSDAAEAAIAEAARGAGEVATVIVEPPAPVAAKAATEAPAASAARTRSVRIQLSRLDALLNLVGELVIARGRLQALVRGLPEPALHEAVTDASRLIGDLQAEVMTARLVPVGQIFDRFPRLVRDLARQLGKEVLFAIEGKGIELDRSVLDEIGEAVVHLLRNAVDHGLETPEVRVAQGKPRAGRLTLSAQRDRTSVLLTVRDDGRGIDRARVHRQAIEAGLLPADAPAPDDAQLLQVLAMPGFTTAATVTDVSGRGVGIDAVLTKVRGLGGSVALATAPGQGTTLSVRLPVTLAIVRALLARVGDERYALPITHVRETLDGAPLTVTQEQGREVLQLRAERIPVVRLRDVVQLPGARPGPGEVVVIERGDRRAGLVVDEVTGQEDIVVKAFDAVKDGTTLFSGATILADGAPALIVDVGSLL